MKKLLLLLALSASAAFCQAPDYQIVVSNTIIDASGSRLASGQVCFQGVADNGQPIPFRAGGGGAIHTEKVCTPVTSGFMTQVPIANSSLTYPVNVAYIITIIDNTSGETISTLGPSQISCSILPLPAPCLGITNNSQFDLDAFEPGNSPLALIQNGPPGPTGPQGPMGVPGTVTATGTNGSFDVPGFLLTGNGPMIDVTESTYGADKTGAADATAAIQAAINACQTAGGGTVYLPIGTYKIASTSGVIVSKPGCNFIGNSRMGTIISAVNGGPGVTIQMNPFVSTGAGRYGDFTIVGTSAGTIGLLTGSVVGGTFENILVYGYTASGGIGIDLQNRLDYSPTTGGTWTERNVFLNVQSGGVTAATNNTKGWNFEVIGGGSSVSFGYNRFLNVQANANSGQIGFNVSAPSFLYHTTLILTCNLGDGASFSTPSICIHSDGNGDQNWSQVTGEYNGSHTSYSVDGTRFVGTGSVDVTLATMHFTGTPDNAPRMRVTAGVEGNTADTGSYAMQPTGTATTPSIIFGDHQGYSNFGLLSGSGINSPFMSMFESAGNKAIICSLPFGTALSGCHERWSADSGGNTFQTGGLWVGFPNFTSIVGGYTAQINGGLLVRGTAGVQLTATGAMDVGGNTSSQRAGWYSAYFSGTTGINETLGFADTNWSAGVGAVTGTNIAHPISWGLVGDPFNYEWYDKTFATPLTAPNKIADLTNAGVFEANGYSLGVGTGIEWTDGVGAPSGACVTGSLYTDKSAGTLSVCQSSAWVAK
jgi:hypothetical protein